MSIDNMTGAEWSPPRAWLGVCRLLLNHGPGALQPSASLRQATTGHRVANRKVLRAAMLLIVAAGGIGQGAAGPGEAEAEELPHAATGVIRWALCRVVARYRLRLGGLRARAGRCGRRLRRVGPFLDWERGLHGNAALPLCAKVAQQADVALVAPLRAPAVLHKPVRQMVGAVGGTAISHDQNAVIQGSPTLRIEHTAAVQLKGTLQNGWEGQEDDRGPSTTSAGTMNVVGGVQHQNNVVACTDRQTDFGS